jgi:serine/threonine-protein kinase
VYAIGIVLFEMLTGRLPFVGTDQQELAMAHIRETPPRAAEFNPNVPEHLDRILQKVLAKEPTSRYRTADQFGRILVSYRRRGQVTTDVVPEVSAEVPFPDTAATVPPSGPLPPVQMGNRAAGPEPAIPQPIPAPTGSPRSEAPTYLYSEPVYRSPVTAQGMASVSRPAYSPPQPPDSMIQSRYRAIEEPPQLDLVTLVLAFIALIAVMLLIPLWIAVYQAWAG